MTDANGRLRLRRYGICPKCDVMSIRIEPNGKLPRHSIGFGSVEKVGPGTRYPMFRTTICKGSGLKVSEVLQ